MDTNVITTKGGKKYNQFREEIIQCVLCNNLTTMLGTKRCDGCWELETRVHAQPKLARAILDELEYKRGKK